MIGVMSDKKMKRQIDKKIKTQKEKKNEKMKRQKYKEKKRVLYCDVRTVSHSCNVFLRAETFCSTRNRNLAS